MGFTVNRPGGTKDTEFESYARLLRQRGVDLGQVPRVPDPGTKNRWLYVWPTLDEAENFARELRLRTHDNAWEVLEVNSPPSEGPLGPVLIQASRRSDSVVFALHPISRSMLRSAFPDAQPAVATATIPASNWYRLIKLNAHINLNKLVFDLTPALTGLQPEQLETLGFAVIDDASGETLAFERPRGVA